MCIRDSHGGHGHEDHKLEQTDHGGHGRVGREDYDVEDLILDNESRRTMTRGIAQLAASRRAARHGRLPPSTYVILPLDYPPPISPQSQLLKHKKNLVMISYGDR